MKNDDLEEKTGLGGIYFPRLFFLTEEEVTSMKVPQLKSHLKEVNLSVEGKKMVLTTRLMEAVRVASFFSVEKCEWTGVPNLFRGPVVTLSQEIPNKCLGISSVDAQIVKHRFVNLFMLKGMNKSTAQREAKAWLRTQLYPTRSWCRTATSTERSTMRSRQQHIRNFLFGATGAYKATQKNLEYIGNLLEETKKEVKGLKYYPVEHFIDAEGIEKYKATKKRLKEIVGGKVITGHTFDDLRKAKEDNEDFKKLLMKQARSLFEESRYYQLGQRIKRLRAHRKTAVKKAIEPAHYYIENQPWMYKADTQVGPDELLSQCTEWLDSATLLNTEIPFPFIGDGHRSLFDTQPLHEMEIVVRTWIDPETGDKLPTALTLDLTAVSAETIQRDQSRMEERSEFLSALDDLINSL